jgi:hypothetical protein
VPVASVLGTDRQMLNSRYRTPSAGRVIISTHSDTKGDGATVFDASLFPTRETRNEFATFDGGFLFTEVPLAYNAKRKGGSRSTGSNGFDFRGKEK